ncbi:MAG: 50S ribosomal protein L23 [Candidatus Omnitrophica bacterium]|nr:50S ribosomal protein L23 [Candidatus Omnitrophota bacterium]MBI5143590.1 50S ribosomal protein L23 [Candidatus Omnitrophota bacterium]
MANPYDVVKGCLRTEKGSKILPMNKYLFRVDVGANKIAIKEAIEDIYKVRVESVNTLIRPGKPKRVRYAVGKTSEWKEAIVTLKEGSKIDVT